MKILQPNQKLLKFIFKWRKIQRDNWHILLQVKQKQILKNQIITFLDLKFQIEKGKDSQQLFKLIDSYILNSNIGTYKFRLDALRLISKLGKSQQFNCINKIRCFYQARLPQILSLIQQWKKQYRNQLMEYRKLAGWKSNTYLIMRSTLQKFRKKIYKIVKSYQLRLQYSSSQALKNFDKSKLINSLNQANQKLKQYKIQDCSAFYQISNQILQQIERLKSQTLSDNMRFKALKDYIYQLQLMIPVCYHQQIDFNNFQVLNLIPQKEKLSKYMTIIYSNLSKKGLQVGWKERNIIQKCWKLIQNGWKWLNYYLINFQRQIKINQQSDLKRLCQNLYNFNRCYFYLQQQHQVQTFLNKLNQFFQLKIQFIQFDQIKEQTLKSIKLKKSSKRADVDILIIKNNLKQLINKYNSLSMFSYQVKKIPLLDLPFQSNQLLSYANLIALLSNITLNLQIRGFCTSKQSQNKQGLSENKQGTGIGQGKGAKNITSEIQFQQQILGQNHDQQDIYPQQIQNKKEKDQQFQVQNSLSGIQSNINQNQENNNSQINQQFGNVNAQNQQLQKRNQEQKNQQDHTRKGEKDFNTENGNQISQHNQQKRKSREFTQKKQSKQKSQSNQNISQQQQIQLQDGYWNKMDQGQNLQISSCKQEMQLQNQQLQQQQQKNRQDQQQQQQQYNYQDYQSMQIQKQKQQINLPRQNKVQNQAPQDPLQVEQSIHKKQKFKNQINKQQSYGKKEGNDELKTQNQNVQNLTNELGKQRGQKFSNSQNNVINNKQFLEQLIVQSFQNKNQFENLQLIKQKINCQNQSAFTENLTSKYDFSIDSEAKFLASLNSLKPQTNQKIQRNEIQMQQPTSNKQQNQQAQSKQITQQQLYEIDQAKKTRIQTQQKLFKKIAFKNNLKLSQNKIQIQKIPSQMIIQNFQFSQNEKKQIQNLIKIKEINQINLLYQKLKDLLQMKSVSVYSGDYKTGKKLNMKRIIPFIASNYRKDKIWMRRSIPNQLNYQILIAIDDSSSMKYLGQKAFSSSVIILLALQKLKIKTFMAKFTNQMEVLCSGQQLTIQKAQSLSKKFSFDYSDNKSLNFSHAKFMKQSIQFFNQRSKTQSNIEQLCFVISDGKFNKTTVRQLCNVAESFNITYIYLIVQPQQKSQSIMNIRSVGKDIQGKLVIRDYMQDFPFRYYSLVNNIQDLSDIIIQILSQYILFK